MFRPMRRPKNAIPDEQAKKLLREEKRGVIAMNGDDGYPFAIPVDYFYDETAGKIYFHGAKSGYKVDALRRCDKVCFTVYGGEFYKNDHWAPYVQSVLVYGRCRLVEDIAVTEARVRELAMKYYPSAEEVEAMERAFLIGYHMHTLAMHMCHPGVIEREIAGAIEGIAKSSGSGLSFPSIVSQHGETLHNLNADGVLEQGRLLLCDAGCETVDGYCSDHTRTYPVSGRFTQKQKEIYNVVLAAHDHVARIVKPHMMYTEIHNAAYMTLAEGLVALGLLKGTAADAVASGAMTMLMPHGLGHGLGMDVHDCEAMGERSFDFSTIADRAAKSGTCIYRAAWRIEPGTVMTDEPGLYFIPALIDKCRAEGLYKGIVDYDALEAYRDFGGIRIEDDILVTEEGSRMLGDRKIPITVEELEAAVGR